MKHGVRAEIIAITVAFIIIGCSFDHSPRHSLSELKSALINHDADTAVKYIDIDSVVASYVNDLLSRNRDTEHRHSDSLGLTMARGMANLVRPAMNAFAERQLKAAISSDDQWGYVDDIRRTHMWYFKIVEEGDVAIVEPRGKSDFYLVMTKSSSGLWRITQIKGN